MSLSIFGISFYKSVVLDSLCEAIGWGPLVELTGVAVLSVLALLSLCNQLRKEIEDGYLLIIVSCTKIDGKI